MCILEIQQIKMSEFFQSRNDFYQTVPWCRCFYINSITFKEFWLYELESHIVCIERRSVKYVQKITFFNWMHGVYLSPQSRLTLLNMITQFIKNFYRGFHLLLLPQDKHSRNSTNEKLWFFPKLKWFFLNCPLLATTRRCPYDCHE